MRIPTPSPRGTNKAGLFLAQRARSPVAAYDSAQGLRRDEEGAQLTAEGVLRILDHLCSRLPPEEQKKVSEMLADWQMADPTEKVAGDEPLDFSGKPITGGGQVP